jgi:RNA polymerase sigma-70 factor (ECF subfamily)
VEPDEQQLITQAAGGDLEAFERLYRMHVSRVYGLCLRLTNGQDEAQDATQETFIKAWQHLAEFRGTSALSTWLHRIAFNEVMAGRRKHTRQMSHLTAVESRSTTDDSTAVDELERALTQLPDRARQAFVLQKIYGYTHEEAADIMGIAVGTCKAQVHRAATLLAESISKPTAGSRVEAATTRAQE